MDRLQRRRAKNFAEFWGSFFINFTIQNINVGNAYYTPFVIGTAFFISVFLAAKISGGHLNAAVTFSVYLNARKRDPSEPFDKYAWEIAYQVLGGLTAGFLTFFMGFTLVALEPSNEITLLEAGILETFFSILLCLCYANLSDPKFPPSDPVIAGIIIGATKFLTNMTLGNLTGGIINPSTAFSIGLSRAIFISPEGMQIMWLYVIAPLVGALIAHWFYERFMKDEIAKRASQRMQSAISDHGN